MLNNQRVSLLIPVGFFLSTQIMLGAPAVAQQGVRLSQPKNKVKKNPKGALKTLVSVIYLFYLISSIFCE